MLRRVLTVQTGRQISREECKCRSLSGGMKISDRADRGRSRTGTEWTCIIVSRGIAAYTTRFQRVGLDRAGVARRDVDGTHLERGLCE